jgi:hypothetical protein
MAHFDQMCHHILIVGTSLVHPPFISGTRSSPAATHGPWQESWGSTGGLEWV